MRLIINPYRWARWLNNIRNNQSNAGQLAFLESSIGKLLGAILHKSAQPYRVKFVNAEVEADS
ncbi:MAG: hypothetical protein H6Q04_2036 [Acidobacteria bacterium]|nr:hypothetical protein [Acidobacteriota bacterium]